MANDFLCGHHWDLISRPAPATDTQRCVVYGQRVGGVAGVYSYFGYPFPLLAMSRKHAGKLNQHLYVGHYLGTQDSL